MQDLETKQGKEVERSCEKIFKQKGGIGKHIQPSIGLDYYGTHKTYKKKLNQLPTVQVREKHNDSHSTNRIF